MSVNYDSFLSSIYTLTNKSKVQSITDMQKHVAEKIGDLPIPEPDNDYWRNLLMKKGYYEFSDEDAKIILDYRIEFIKHYYEKLFSGALTEKELEKPKPKHYRGPYLPTPKEIRAITNLDVYIDWEVPEHQHSLQCRGKFNRTNNLHKEKILRRWMLFQTEYGIYDLRPLIGERCCLIQTSIDNDEDEYIFYRLLQQQQLRSFLMYLAKDSKELNLQQVHRIAMYICDNFENGKLVTSTYVFRSGLEHRLIDEIFNRFPDSPIIERYLSILTGKRSHDRYIRYCNTSGQYRNIPFKDGFWTTAERLRLIKYAKEFSRENELKSFIASKEKLPWTKIFLKFKLRQPFVMRLYFNFMKQCLLDGMTVREKGPKVSLRWKEEQTAKLIELIYDSEAESVGDVDWFQMAEHFPGYSEKFVSQIFRSLVKTRVPASKKTYFTDTKDYLYHKIKPVFLLRDINRRERKKRMVLLEGLESCFNNDEIDELLTSFENMENEIIIGENSFIGADNSAQINQDKKFWNHKTPSKNCMVVSEEDDVYWQELMARYKFQFSYPPKLRAKLKCILEPEKDEISAQSPSTPAASYSNKNRSINSSRGPVRTGSTTVRFGRKNKYDSEGKSTGSEVFKNSIKSNLKNNSQSHFLKKLEFRLDKEREREIEASSDNKDMTSDKRINYLLSSSDNYCEELKIERKRKKKAKDKTDYQCNQDIVVIDLSDDESKLNRNCGIEQSGDNNATISHAGSDFHSNKRCLFAGVVNTYKGIDDDNAACISSASDVLRTKVKDKKKKKKYKFEDRLISENESQTVCTDIDDLTGVITSKKHKKKHKKDHDKKIHEDADAYPNNFNATLYIGGRTVQEHPEIAYVRKKPRQDFGGDVYYENSSVFEDNIDCKETKRDKKRKRSRVCDDGTSLATDDANEILTVEQHKKKKKKKQNCEEWEQTIEHNTTGDYSQSYSAVDHSFFPAANECSGDVSPAIKRRKQNREYSDKLLDNIAKNYSENLTTEIPNKKKKKKNKPDMEQEITSKYNHSYFSVADYSVLTAANECSKGDSSSKKRRKHNRKYSDETPDNSVENYSETFITKIHRKKKKNKNMELSEENNCFDNRCNQTNCSAGDLNLHSPDILFLDNVLTKKRKKIKQCYESNDNRTKL